jgi:hypothetical protein
MCIRDRSIMSAVLGGIEEFYEIISNDIECDMKIN